MFAFVKKPAKEIYHRDKWYLWRLFSIVIALYLCKDILLALTSSLPALPHTLLDAVLSIALIPFGFGISHMLIHEEHYDHMKADGLFRFYRNPKIVIRCLILVLLTTGVVKGIVWGLEEVLHHLIHNHTLLVIIEILIFVIEEAIIAYFYLVHYLFLMHEGHSLFDIIKTSCHAMQGDILNHLCFDFSLFAWYILPIGIWLGLGGLISLLSGNGFVLPSLDLRTLSGDLYSILYTVIITIFYFFYTPYVALAKILFAEHAWEEAKEHGKVTSTRSLPKQTRVTK